MKLWKIHARANSLRLRKCKSLHLRLEVRESLKLGFHLLCIFILKNNNERCCHIFPVLNNLLNNKYYDICRLNLHVELFVWVEKRHIVLTLVFTNTSRFVFYQYENTHFCAFYSNLETLVACSSSSDCREIVPLQPSGKVY